MRRSETVKLSELIKASIAENKLEDGLDKVRVKELWFEVAGSYAVKATKDVYVENQKLYVSLSSSIIRSEIMLIRSELVKRINQQIGRNFITEIIVR